MWCCCCTPEEEVDWKKEVEILMKDVKKIERLGRKSIRNKQIGRKDYYLENDILDYFYRVDRGLLNLKKVAVSFLVTQSSFEQLQYVHRKNATQQMQYKLLQLKQQREELASPEDDDETEENEASSSDPIVSTQNELINRLYKQLASCENEVENLHSQINNYKSRWQAQDEEEPSTSHNDYEQGMEESSNSPLNDFLLTGAQNFAGQVLSNLVDSTITPYAADTFKLLPQEKKGKKIRKQKDACSSEKSKKDKKNKTIKIAEEVLKETGGKSKTRNLDKTKPKKDKKNSVDETLGQNEGKRKLGFSNRLAIKIGKMKNKSATDKPLKKASKDAKKNKPQKPAKEKSAGKGAIPKKKP